MRVDRSGHAAWRSFWVAQTVARWRCDSLAVHQSLRRQDPPGATTLDGMCGICGVIQVEGPPRPVIFPEVLAAMTDVMTHRGPNDRGIHFEDGAGARRPPAEHRRRGGRSSAVLGRAWVDLGGAERRALQPRRSFATSFVLDGHRLRRVDATPSCSPISTSDMAPISRSSSAASSPLRSGTPTVGAL